MVYAAHPACPLLSARFGRCVPGLVPLGVRITEFPVNEIKRTASILSAIGTLSIASVAFGVAPDAAGEASTQPAPAVTGGLPTVSPTQSSSDVPTAAEPPQAAPRTNQATPDSRSSPSSVAASPYGPESPPPATSENRKPSSKPQRPYDGPPTLLEMSGDYAIGGFGGIGVMYTRFAGGGSPQVCGEGGVIIDHVLELGGGGCGITSTVDAYEKYGPEPHYPDDRMGFGYGGFLVRYHLFSRNIVNLGVGALIGAGGLTIGTWDTSEQEWSSDYKHMRSEAVFVFEPHVGAYTNFTRWLRIGAVAGYRLVSGVDTPGVKASDLAAPTLGGVLQGGWF